MSVRWTEEQMKVISLRDRNILVSAAAGSGKTAVLVERIISMITDSQHPVEDVYKRQFLNVFQYGIRILSLGWKKSLGKRLGHPEIFYLILGQIHLQIYGWDFCFCASCWTLELHYIMCIRDSLSTVQQWLRRQRK